MSGNFRDAARKLIAIAFFVFILLVAYWADTGSMPAALRALAAFPNGDRVGHFVLYGTLAYLLSAAFPFRRLRFLGWTLTLGVGIALGLALAEELSQFFIPARTPDIFDLAAGWLGIYVSTWIPCMRDACPPSS